MFFSMNWMQLLAIPPMRYQEPTQAFLMGARLEHPSCRYTHVKWQGNSPLYLAISFHFGNSSYYYPSMNSRPILLPPNSNQYMLFVMFRYKKFASEY